jgi:outer membrane protein assembly factor BamB
MRPNTLILTTCSLTAVLAAASPALAAGGKAASPGAAYNEPGDILISDQFNNRVIEIDRKGNIVWSFGLGPNDVSANSPVGVNDALRVKNKTLVSGTGAPPGTEPLCPSGCADNRVMLVARNGNIVWQYGTFGVTGSGPNQLNTPVQATWTANRTVLITDQANQRVIEVNLKGKLIWQYGQTGVAGAGADQLSNPNSVEVLDNGDYLIADQSNNRAIVVNRAKAILAVYTAGGTLNGVAFASQLPDGHILITDSNNNRIVEVNKNDQIVWSYVTNTQPGSNPAPLPTRAVRLKSGDTVISDQFNHRVIVVSPKGLIRAQYGNLNVPGFGTTSTTMGLNAPYDAKVLGDNTGLTWFPGAVIPGR